MLGSGLGIGLKRKSMSGVEFGDDCPACGNCEVTHSVDWSNYTPGAPLVHEYYAEDNWACIDKEGKVTYFHRRGCWDDGEAIL